MTILVIEGMIFQTISVMGRKLLREFTTNQVYKIKLTINTFENGSMVLNLDKKLHLYVSYIKGQRKYDFIESLFGKGI